MRIAALSVLAVLVIVVVVNQNLGAGFEFCAQSNGEGESVILGSERGSLQTRSLLGGDGLTSLRLKRSTQAEKSEHDSLGILQQLSQFLGAYQTRDEQHKDSFHRKAREGANPRLAELEGRGGSGGDNGHNLEPIQAPNDQADNRQQFSTGRQRPKPATTTSTTTTSDDDQAAPQAQTPTVKVIETAVFIDQALDNKFTGLSNGLVELNKLVLTIMNQVQYLFEYSSLQVSIKLKLVLVEHLKESERLTGMPAPNPERGDIDAYLSNFCNWQQSRLQSEKRLWWDHAILLSGLDLYKATPGKNHTGVLGLAWVGGMCKGNYSCTINEASNFESAFVIAHEIGHSLGIMHDGQKNKCDPNTFIMSERTGAGKVHWSKCSNAYLNESIQRGQLKCLDSEQNNQIDSLYDLTKLRAPGQVYTINEQCRLAFGSNYSSFVAQQHPFNAVCRELWCVSGTWAKAAHPALEGSLCGQHELVCREGKCIKVAQ